MAETIDPVRIAIARRYVIGCYTWLALTPFAFWFAISNIQNLWLSVPPIIFGCLATAPLLFSWAVWSEYSDARKGIHSF